MHAPEADRGDPTQRLERAIRYWGQLLWPTFLAACLLEFLVFAIVDPAELHSTRSSLEFVTSLADQILDLFPFLAGVKVNRQWAGMADMTPDFAPVMGTTAVRGFYLDAGWGTWGFKATPVCGETMASTVANDANHPLISAFGAERFARLMPLGEKGAAAVGH